MIRSDSISAFQRHWLLKNCQNREFPAIRKIEIGTRRTAAYLAGGAEPLARVGEAQGEDARVVPVQLVAVLRARRRIHHLKRDQRSKINWGEGIKDQ